MKKKLILFVIALISGSSVVCAWSWMSPYAYCNNNPVMLVDPDGQSPIYDTNGNFLGTDDTGLQGNYYVMDAKNFTQGMAHMEVGDFAVMGDLAKDVLKKINAHFGNLPTRPDYDGFVSASEGVAWAKAHPNALKNPTADNTLYIDASKLDFGSLSTSDFPSEGAVTPQNLFSTANTVESAANPTLAATVYALGRVDMILTNKEQRSVRIVNNAATDYDWNPGGGTIRNAAIQINNRLTGIDPRIHGFKAYYYGVGHLRK